MRKKDEDKMRTRTGAPALKNLPPDEAQSLAQLMAAVDLIAVEEFGGHLTILRFGSGWKGAFGTVDLDGLGRMQVRTWPNFITLQALLTYLIKEHPDAGEEYRRKRHAWERMLQGLEEWPPLEH